MAVPKPAWIVQVVPPRDFFEDCTLTVPRWVEENNEYESSGEKWQQFIEACSLALSGIIAHGGLRQEPRVGFDPAHDRPYFIFKTENGGATIFVSRFGLHGDDFDSNQES